VNGDFTVIIEVLDEIGYILGDGWEVEFTTGMGK
jgi:hypothetical protein